LKSKGLLLEESILFFTFFILSIISLCFFNYLKETYELEKLSQRYYSSNTIYFSIKPDDSKLQLKKIYDQLENSILFKEISINDDIRGVLFKGNIDPPPMLQGRFFHENDFFNHQNVAVIGRDYTRFLEQNGDEYSITISDQVFKVIGIIGIEKGSNLDQMILVNLDSVNEIRSAVYALDGKNKLQIKKTYNTLRHYFNSNNINLYIILREKTGIKRLLQYEKNNIFIYFFIFISFLLSSISVILSWFEKIKVQIDVQRLIGYRNKIIIYEIVKRHLILVNLSYFIALFVILILSTNSIIPTYFSLLNIYAYLIIIITSTIIVLGITTHYLQKQNIISNLAKR